MSVQNLSDISEFKNIKNDNARNEKHRGKIAKHIFFDTLHHNYRPYPKDKTIYEVFQEQVEKTPDKVAISFKGETLTYKELNEKSNQLARYIRKQYETYNGKDLKPDTLIAIFVDKSLDMIVSIMGILKSGAAYVPIDSKSPDDRISYVLNDTQCPFVLTQSHLVDKLNHCFETLASEDKQRETQITSLILMDEMTYRQEHSDNLGSHSEAGDLAYVIYTSGTTGRPKGVMIEHHSVLNLSSSRLKDYSLDDSSVVLQASPIAFDGSVCEIFSTLLNGAKLSIIDDTTKRDPASLIDYLLSEKVSIATFLPSLLSQLALTELPEFPYLKTLIVAGEACTSDVISTWRKRRNLINGYGPTETTVCATLSPYKDGDAPSVIGNPIPNTCIYILDDNLEPVPTGETGELYVSGVSLARGYFNQPEITAERFIDNRFVGQLDKDNGYSKLYKTGDLARWLDDGRLEYIGRNDSQVKIRGYRIELGEIQMALLSYPGIKQVCVLAKDRANINSQSGETTLPNSVSSKYLVVYYLAENKIDSERFVEHLSQSLPDYMIPSHFIWLEFFPQTANGKIDYQALPEPQLDSDIQDYVPPSTKLEHEICSIWQSVLGMDRIGVECDFFSIGGDSLSVISLVAFTNAKFGEKINASMIYEYSTISAQAKLIQNNRDLQSEGNRHQDLQLITTFRSQGENTPLFFIHPSLTGAEIYRDMVEWFDQDQPFYGVESYNLSHLNSPEVDMKALASCYANAIREVQPVGPYQLGGYSAGGNIAFEVANQLITSGETVDKLYLIDSVQPNTAHRKEQVTYEDARNFLEYFGFNPADERLLGLAKTEMALLFGYFPKSRLPIKVVLIKAKNYLSPLDTLPEDHVANYFFQPNETFSSWDLYAREVHRYEIEANHHSIIDSENLRQVANIIQKDIKSIEFAEKPMIFRHDRCQC